MTDDIFTTDQSTLNTVLLSDDVTGFGDDDLADDILTPEDLENEEDPDAVEEDSYDDKDDF